MPLLRMLVALLLLLAAGGPLRAAPVGPSGVYGFRSFGADHGLDNTAVKALGQDGEGFLWVGTEDGLFRLEGSRFRRFGEDDGLPSARIVDGGLAPAHPVGLWVDTVRGLVLWDGTRFLQPSQLGMPGKDGRPGTPLAHGGVIFSDQPGQTRFLARGREGFQPIQGLPWGQGMTAATLSRDGRTLVVALQRELWIRRDGVWNGGGAPLQLPAIPTGVLVDRRGTVWARAANQLWRLEQDRRIVEVSTPRPLSVVSIGVLAEGADGRIWTPTAEGVLWIGEDGAGFLGETEGLPGGATGAMMVDREGTLWLGGDGVHKLLGEGLWTSWTRRQGLPGDVTWSLTRTPDGRLWAGGTAGLAVQEEGRWHAIPGTSQRQVMALAADGEGRLWAGLVPGGPQDPVSLWVVDPGRRAIRPVRLPGLPPGRAVMGLHWQPGGSLWVAAAAAGLWRVDPGRPDRSAGQVDIPGWPKDFGVQVVYGDGKGGLWVAGGPWVGHFDGRTWAVLGPGGGLRSQDAVLVMAPRSDGSAWLAYAEAKGLDRVQRVGNRLELAERFGKGHPLGDYLLYSMITVPDGSLWAGSARGVFHWDGRRVERYGRNAGLPGEDCSQNAIWMDPGGDLYVGLSVGVARGRTGRIHAPQLPPPASIVTALDGRDRSFLMDASPTVPWKARTLTFRHSPLGSRWTEDTAYEVRLLGLEQEWRRTTLPEARYTGLAPGLYRYEVRTVTFLGERGEIAGLDLRILAPWWRKPWALAAAGLLLGLAAWGLYHWRTALLRRRNAQLEAMVHERTQALEVANAALQEASLVDPLTWLHNRRYLAATMPEEEIRLRRVFRTYLDRGESPLGRNEDLVLFLMDLDHFKNVNDTHGHRSGDLVLRQTAQVLRAACRTSDSLVRWGGEEFLLVAKRTDRNRAELIAENICSAIRKHVYELPDGGTLRCTISVGYAACPILEYHPEAFGWEDALQVADQCLYAVKRLGRNGWMGVHTPGPMDPSDLGSRLRVDVEGLAAEGRITLHRSFG